MLLRSKWRVERGRGGVRERGGEERGREGERTLLLRLWRKRKRIAAAERKMLLRLWRKRKRKRVSAAERAGAAEAGPLLGEEDDPGSEETSQVFFWGGGRGSSIQRE